MIDLITREINGKHDQLLWENIAIVSYVVIMDNICSKNGELDSRVELDFKTEKPHKKQEFDPYWLNQLRIWGSRYSNKKSINQSK